MREYMSWRNICDLFICILVKEEEYYSDVTCYRCGRKGHIKPDCYASKHINGYYL